MRRLIVTLGVLIAGCGGVGASGPDSYETYAAPQASFAHPRGWEVKRDNTTWTAEAPGDRTASIVLSVSDVAFESAHTELRGIFERGAKQLAQSLNAELERYSLMPAGADEAVAYRVRGTIGGEQRTVVCIYAVLADRKSVVQLIARGPNDGFDAEAVAESFRLKND